MVSMVPVPMSVSLSVTVAMVMMPVWASTPASAPFLIPSVSAPRAVSLVERW